MQADLYHTLYALQAASAHPDGISSIQTPADMRWPHLPERRGLCLRGFARLSDCQQLRNCLGKIEWSPNNNNTNNNIGNSYSKSKKHNNDTNKEMANRIRSLLMLTNSFQEHYHSDRYSGWHLFSFVHRSSYVGTTYFKLPFIRGPGSRAVTLGPYFGLLQ